jgi:hypothetical protein
VIYFFEFVSRKESMKISGCGTASVESAVTLIGIPLIIQHLFKIVPVDDRSLPLSEEEISHVFFHDK